MDAGFAIVFGFALGFSLTIPPGPMNALIAAQSVRSLRSGIITGLGAMSADLILAVLVYSLRAEIPFGSIVRWVYLVGAGVMVFLGTRLLLRPRTEETTPDSHARTYTQGVLVGLSNPFQIVWWLTAGLAFAYLGGLLLFVALFAAVAIWVVAFPYALHLGTRRHPGVSRAVVYVSCAILFAFAVYFVLLAL
ncbi:MAG TPA: LysE family transporter [Thermoplasmata archaeon]|nr:LysE family transporter [Thermoplasmata archaeon]